MYMKLVCCIMKCLNTMYRSCSYTSMLSNGALTLVMPDLCRSVYAYSVILLDCN